MLPTPPWKKKKAVTVAVQQARSGLVHVELGQGQSGPDRCDVIGSIFFSRVLLETEIGNVELHLTGGKVRFIPENGRIPVDSIPEALTPPPNISREVSVTAQRSHSSEESRRHMFETSGTAKLKVLKQFDGAEASAKAQAESQGKKGSGSSESLTYSCKAGGMTASPYGKGGMEIDIAAAPGADGLPEQLRGRLHNDRLCTLVRNGTATAAISTRFQPMPSNVVAGEGTGVWQKDLSTEKRKLMQRLIAKLIDGPAWDLGRSEFIEATDGTP